MFALTIALTISSLDNNFEICSKISRERSLQGSKFVIKFIIVSIFILLTFNNIVMFYVFLKNIFYLRCFHI